MICEARKIKNIPEKLKQFWISQNTQIYLDNNRSTSLMVALICIIVNLKFNNADYEKVCEKALSILRLSYTQENREVDYKIYETNFVNDYEKIYAEMRKPLQFFLINELKTNMNTNLSGLYIDLISHAKLFDFESIR